jgi:2-methylisocitrate lyase-like PEP mutase family enzyme
MNTFASLHNSLFVLGNIWDVQSARTFEATGYKAIGTSSMAVAIANGYNDGQQIPFSLLLQLAHRVTEVVKIPFSVDLEAGYGRGILDNISRLQDAGVAGINLEDTIGGHLQSIPDFTKTLTAVADHISRNNLNIFVNLRTDGFLLGLPNALEETLPRIKAYQDAGADGIFVPCITQSEDIREVVASTYLPVNVMAMPGLPAFDELEALGVKRISMGSFLYNKVNDATASYADAILKDKNFSSII